MRIQKILAAAALLVAGMFPAAEAAPVTYTLSGMADGSVGATTFTNTAFTWTFNADSNDLLVFGPVSWILPFNSDSLEIAGIGTITPDFQIGAINNLFIPEVLLLTDATISGGIIVSSPALLTYNGISSLGPIPVHFEDSAPLSSDMGDFVLTGTFFTLQVTGVPEPLTLALFGSGLAGIGILRRRRKAHG